VADPIRLAQVVGNLLQNAAKYTERAGRIELTVAREGEEAVLRVRDQGIGIAPELLPHVFGLFVQAERALAYSQGGLGIGLTLVKRLIEAHGGSVVASSPGIGQGSEFTVRLPALTGAASEETATSTAESGRQLFPSRRILVVDDNVDAAESLARLLTRWGHKVRTTYDGPSALQAALAHRPEFVLLDIGLPVMDGYEVARKLRAQPEFEAVPLAAVTGYGQEDDQQRSQNAGFDYHFTKPLDPSELQEFLTSFHRT
jgi:CheY-like chemotaxis protein